MTILPTEGKNFVSTFNQIRMEWGSRKQKTENWNYSLFLFNRTDNSNLEEKGKKIDCVILLYIQTQ